MNTKFFDKNPLS